MRKTAKNREASGIRQSRWGAYSGPRGHPSWRGGFAGVQRLRRERESLERGNAEGKGRYTERKLTTGSDFATRFIILELALLTMCLLFIDVLRVHSTEHFDAVVLYITMMLKN